VLHFLCIFTGSNSTANAQMGYSSILAGAECTECAMLPTNQGSS